MVAGVPAVPTSLAPAETVTLVDDVAAVVDEGEDVEDDEDDADASAPGAYVVANRLRAQRATLAHPEWMLEDRIV